MPRIRCHYVDCVFLDDGYCGAAAVEVDPDEGCLTYTRTTDFEEVDEDWEGGDEIDDLDEWEEIDFEDEEEEIWIDDDEEY